MSTPIVRITQFESDTSHVIVDSGYVDALHRHLNEQGIRVTPPREAISRIIRIYRTPEGRIEREEEVLDHTFDAEAPLEAIEKSVGQWLKTLR